MARHPRPHFPSLWAGIALGTALGLFVAIPISGHNAAVQTTVNPQELRPITLLALEREPRTAVSGSSYIQDHPEDPRTIRPTATPSPTPEPTPKPTPKPKPKPKATAAPVFRVSTSYRPNRTFPANVVEARRYAKSRIGTRQFACLDILWDKESGWRTKALNKSSGAYGIPQALPGTKMAKAGDDWRTNPVTQVRWGLGYISGRYGSACNALQHFYNTGWY